MSQYDKLVRLKEFELDEKRRDAGSILSEINRLTEKKQSLDVSLKQEQTYHQNTLNRIEKLQSLEGYLWNNMNKLKDGNQAASSEIRNKLRELKEMRIALLKQLNGMYVREQDQLSIARSNLVNHQTSGDILDKSSRVVKEKKDPRSYVLLEEFNTQPSVFYKTKVRNKKV